MKIKLEAPKLQIDFAASLKELRSTCLQDALVNTIGEIEIERVDKELHQYSPTKALKILAAHGMRGELLLAVPCILQQNPRLIGYYRLLLGYSQKSFYTAKTGVGIFKSMEEKGVLSNLQKGALPDLCKELNRNAVYLIERMDTKMINATFFDQLTLLTLGPQLRGGANVRRGTSAIYQIYNVLLTIVESNVVERGSRYIEVRNSAGRTVMIRFSSDPDITIQEEMEIGVFRNHVAIEVKGGKDYSNIHNRIGEAEKSHQKAKKDKYVECWTVINVDRLDMEMARKESPTTNQFYHISQLTEADSREFKDFSMQIRAIMGIQ